MAKPKRNFLVKKIDKAGLCCLEVHAIALKEAHLIIGQIEGVTWTYLNKTFNVVQADVSPLYDIDEIKAEIEQKLAAGSETVPEAFNE